MDFFTIGAILVGLSALFAYLNHRFLRLPHTIGLVVIALVVSLVVIAIDSLLPFSQIAENLTGWLRQIDFNKTLMQGMLSFLLFAGGLHSDFSAFRTRRVTIGVLAFIGTFISTFIVAGVLWYLLKVFGIGIPFIWALVFGALISPTDPVAVLGLFKTIEVPETLEAKMAGESMFNDGVGVVFFTVAVAIAAGGGGHGGDLGFGGIAEIFLVEVVGGIVLGLIAGFIAYRAVIRTDEPSLAVLFTLAVVMVTYALALALEMSGPIAMVVAGLFMAGKGTKVKLSEITRDHLLTFWSLLDEILNSVLFLLIGLEVLIVAASLDHLGVALIAIPLTLGARAISVGLPMAVLSRWEDYTKGAYPVMVWGGLRGGIAVALALSMPNNEFKPGLLTITYVIVLFSIIVQGLTIKPLVGKVVR